jgi:hypothetical protein
MESNKISLGTLIYGEPEVLLLGGTFLVDNDMVSHEAHETVGIEGGRHG